MVQRGASPRRAEVSKPEVRGNCVTSGEAHCDLVRWRATRDERPVRRMTNSIRPYDATSLLANGEVLTSNRIPGALALTAQARPRTTARLKGKRSKKLCGASWGGWRQNGQTDQNLTHETCCGTVGGSAAAAGVRASIVASKPGNSGGAKGRRSRDAK
jgi:hypothetical protein